MTTKYTADEVEYIHRVAGRVPAEVMARQLRRSKTTLLNWTARHGISLRVPYKTLCKYWTEYIGGRSGAEAA